MAVNWESSSCSEPENETTPGPGFHVHIGKAHRHFVDRRSDVGVVHAPSCAKVRIMMGCCKIPQKVGDFKWSVT